MTAQVDDRKRETAGREAVAQGSERQEGGRAVMAIRPRLPQAAVILAAGQGSRLYAAAKRPKPLTEVLGLSLLERALLFYHHLGVPRLIVVTGHRGGEVAAHAREIAARRGLDVTCITAGDWEKGNGASALAARGALAEIEGPFYLSMVDHLLDAEMARRLAALPLSEGAVRLAVDRDRAALFDEPDATKVRLKEGEDGELHLAAIGKDLEAWDAVDTGLFLCTKGLFDALEQAAAEGRHTLSDAMRHLIAQEKALAADVTGAAWLDVDTPAALEEAERRLLAAEKGKPHDGPVSRFINRPASRWLSRHLARLPVTPNQITLFSFALALLAAWIMAQPGWLMLALGGVLAQVSSIIDGCDGEIARLKHLKSEFGGWLDAVLDRYADGALLFGLTWHAMQAAQATGGSGHAALLWGFAAIIGSFVNSYTADKYDGLMRKKLGPKRAQRFRMGRDVRVFLVMLGALANLPLLTLAVLAVVMNGEVLRRIWLFWRLAGR